MGDFCGAELEALASSDCSLVSIDLLSLSPCLASNNVWFATDGVFSRLDENELFFFDSGDSECFLGSM